MKIRLLTLEDIDTVTAIHQERFPGSRSTLLGKPFLRKMYRWFIINYPELALAAAVDGQVVGFAVGSMGGYGRRVFRHAILEVMWGLMRHPNLVFNRSTFYLWRSYLRAFTPSFEKKEKLASSNPEIVQAGFASLAVTKSAQGAGVLLIVSIERAAKRKGANLISGTVRKDNVLLQRVYDNLGWQVLHETSVGITYSKRIS